MIAPYGVDENFCLTCRFHPRRGRAKIRNSNVVTKRYFRKVGFAHTDKLRGHSTAPVDPLTPLTA